MLPLDALLTHLDRGEATAHRVAITFDDGYRDNATCAAPALIRQGVPAAIFLVTGAVGSRMPGLERAVPMLGVQDVAELESTGLVRFGSHTLTHRSLPELPDETVRSELAGSREALARLVRRPLDAVAYPFGSASPAVTRLAREAGYAWGLGVHTCRESPLLRARIPIHRRDTAAHLWLKLSGLYAWVRRCLGRPALLGAPSTVH